MSIEEDIKKAAGKLESNKNFDNEEFNKDLPEFIDRAKYLKRRLKKRERLSVGVDKFGLHNFSMDTDFIYLELHKTEGKQKMVALSCLGELAYIVDFFKNFRPLPEYNNF